MIAAKERMLDISSPGLQVVLPGLPPSVNHGYAQMRGGGKRRTSEAVAWAAGAILAVRAAAHEAGGVWPRRQPLALVVSFEDPRYLKFDVDNRLKALIDALMAGLGLDDRYITALNVSKARARVSQTIVSIWLIPEE